MDNNPVEEKPLCPLCDSDEDVTTCDVPIRCSDGDAGEIEGYHCDACSMIFLWEREVESLAN